MTQVIPGDLYVLVQIFKMPLPINPQLIKISAAKGHDPAQEHILLAEDDHQSLVIRQV